MSKDKYPYEHFLFDSPVPTIEIQPSEIKLRILSKTEDVVGNPGKEGILILTNHRIIFYLTKSKKINISLGFSVFQSCSHTFKGKADTRRLILAHHPHLPIEQPLQLPVQNPQLDVLLPALPSNHLLSLQRRIFIRKIFCFGILWSKKSCRKIIMTLIIFRRRPFDTLIMICSILRKRKREGGLYMLQILGSCFWVFIKCFRCLFPCIKSRRFLCKKALPNESRF